MSDALNRPAHFINREVTALAFNERVLQLANDPNIPLLERVRFLCICSGNLDEFFEIRVAGLKEKVARSSTKLSIDGLSATTLLARLSQHTHALIDELYQTFNERLIPQLRAEVGKLFVLEQRPREGELPAEAAPDIIPQADVVALTSMTLLNRTFRDLLELCSPEALVLLLGPSTPLSPVLFDHGIDVLAGSVVTAVGPVLRAIKQGANFRQVHRAGVRLVTLCRPGLIE